MGGGQDWADEVYRQDQESTDGVFEEEDLADVPDEEQQIVFAADAAVRIGALVIAGLIGLVTAIVITLLEVFQV